MKYFAIFAVLLFVFSFAFADGMLFRPDFSLSSASESDQIALINVGDKGYSLDLFVRVQPPESDRYIAVWAVPLEETPQKIELKNYIDSNFDQKLKEFNSASSQAKAYVSRKNSFKEITSAGIFLASPAFPFVLLGFLLMPIYSNVGSKHLEDSLLATYDFGELGSAELYETTQEQTLRNLMERMNIPYNQDLSDYLDKKVVLFKLKNIDDAGLVASFYFNQNERIYFSSGTTKYFSEKPARFGVFIRAPREYVFQDYHGLKQAYSYVGKDEQFIVYNKTGNKYEPGDNYYGGSSYAEHYYSDSAQSYPIFEKDVILENVGERQLTLVEQIMDYVNPLLLGIFFGLVVFFGAVISFFKIRGLFGKKQFVKFLAYSAALSCVFLFILFLLILMLAIPTFLSLLVSSFFLSGSFFQSIFSMVVVLIMLFIILLFFGAISWLFFFFEKDNKKWILFSRKEVLLVSVIVVVLDVILFFVLNSVL